MELETDQGFHEGHFLPNQILVMVFLNTGVTHLNYNLKENNYGIRNGSGFP
jgi:hypothetical protein